MAANHDFEVKQLLKAYRKGIISDDLFESEMNELRNGEGADQYVFNGKSYNSEREMLVAFLDEYRCAENFAAEYLGGWNDVSQEACVKGGLRMIEQREAFHAQLLESAAEGTRRERAVRGPDRTARERNGHVRRHRQDGCRKAPIPGRSNSRPPQGAEIYH